MRTLFAVLVIGALSLGSVGCKNKHKDHDHDMSGSAKMSADGCSHCPGTQTLSADGKCPSCGMKMK